MKKVCTTLHFSYILVSLAITPSPCYVMLMLWHSQCICLKGHSDHSSRKTKQQPRITKEKLIYSVYSMQYKCSITNAIMQTQQCKSSNTNAVTQNVTTLSGLWWLCYQTNKHQLSILLWVSRQLRPVGLNTFNRQMLHNSYNSLVSSQRRQS